MKGSAAKIQMTGLDDLFGLPSPNVAGEQVQEIALSELHTFRNHPFHVVDDDKMQEMAESVAQYGVLVPGIVRPRPDGGYELIAGHRRKRACELAGLDKMRVIVRNMDDDEAVLIMVDSNLQRETIQPSEKAFAYKMKLDAMKRKAGRPCKDNSDPLGPNLLGTRSNEMLASKSPDSKTQIQRYIRLTHLVPELLTMVDNGKLSFRPAVELSYLPDLEQRLLVELLEDDVTPPTMEQAEKLREYCERTELTKWLILDILNEQKTSPVKVTLKSKHLHQYFPKDYTQQQMEEIIFSLLEKWKSDQKEVESNGENV